MLSVSLDKLKEEIYNNNSYISTDLIYWQENSGLNIDTLLNNIYKLSCIGKKLKTYPKTKTFFTPYNDNTQIIRVYLTDTYIVFELNPDPNNYDKWFHIIEHHNPNDKNSPNFYKIKIPNNSTEEFITMLTKVSGMLVDTVEQYLLDIVNNTTSVMDVIAHIRIIENDVNVEKIENDATETLSIKPINNILSLFRFKNKVKFT